MDANGEAADVFLSRAPDVDVRLAPIFPFPRAAIDAETLVAENFVAIYGYLARRVGRDLADDLAAEVFARALQDSTRFDPSLGTERMWLFGIATNLLAKHRRAEQRRLAAYARAGGPSDRSGDDETNDVDERLSAGRSLRILAAGLKRLNARQRDALYLVVVAELTYDEAAAALGVPVGTVRSRVSRARASLRSHLERSRSR